METIQEPALAWQDVPPEARRVPGFSPWDLILIFDLAIVTFLMLGTVLAGPADGTSALPDDPDLVRFYGWFDVVAGLVLFGAAPFLWLLATRVVPWEGTLRWLGIQQHSRHNGWYWAGMGCLLAVGLYALLLVLSWILQATQTDAGGDPTFERLIRAGGWPLVIGISIGAGVGEEILFRGVLQRWMGLYGQAALFGLVHVNQGWIAVAFIALIALLLGMMRLRGMPLWALMLAHAAYDFILLGQLRIAVG